MISFLTSKTKNNVREGKIYGKWIEKGIYSENNNYSINSSVNKVEYRVSKMLLCVADVYIYMCASLLSLSLFL
jgi:hypothetical protein